MKDLQISFNFYVSLSFPPDKLLLQIINQLINLNNKLFNQPKEHANQPYFESGRIVGRILVEKRNQMKVKKFWAIPRMQVECWNMILQ